MYILNECFNVHVHVEFIKQTTIRDYKANMGQLSIYTFSIYIYVLISRLVRISKSSCQIGARKSDPAARPTCPPGARALGARRQTIHPYIFLFLFPGSFSDSGQGVFRFTLESFSDSSYFFSDSSKARIHFPVFSDSGLTLYIYTYMCMHIYIYI